MAATESLRRGDLQAALQELKDEVRAKPQDAAARIFLFQLFAISGEWERAQSQLNVSGQLDPAAELMVQAYTEAIRCERLRAEIFAGKRTPLVLGEPDQWVALLLQSLAMRASGQTDAAERLREQAYEAAPTTSGTIRWRQSGQDADEVVAAEQFEWLADAELMLGPVLETLLDGRYYWVPLKQIRSVRIEPPTDLRDLVWLPAQFTWVGGGQQLGFIPTRYIGSENDPDDAVRLARKTYWLADAEGGEVGRGQRLLATDISEYPLLDVREIDFDLVPGAGPTAEGDKTVDG